MPVSVIKLPPRSGTLEYSAEDQQATLEFLGSVEVGEGVAIDVAQETENKARVRARVMVKLISDNIAEGYRIRVHSVKVSDTEWVPALSLAKITGAAVAADEPAEATEPEPTSNKPKSRATRK